MLRLTFAVPSVILALAVLSLGCQPSSPEPIAKINGNRVETVDVSNEIAVEASCGQCQFGLPGDGCDLAVRIDGKAYFVNGVHIDELGDAHAADGLCNAIRPAKVVGKIENGRFVASSIKLVPADNQP